MDKKCGVRKGIRVFRNNDKVIQYFFSFKVEILSQKNRSITAVFGFLSLISFIGESYYMNTLLAQHLYNSCQTIYN